MGVNEVLVRDGIFWQHTDTFEQALAGSVAELGKNYLEIIWSISNVPSIVNWTSNLMFDLPHLVENSEERASSQCCSTNFSNFRIIRAQLCPVGRRGDLS